MGFPAGKPSFEQSIKSANSISKKFGFSRSTNV